MSYFTSRKPSIALFLLFLVFSVASCGGSKTTVDPYRDTTTSSAVQQPGSAPSKPLPVVQSVQRHANSVTGSNDYSESGGQVVLSEALLPILTLVADRIVAYEDKIQLWNKFSTEAEKISLDDERREKISNCRSLLQDILNNYNQLHEQLIMESPAGSPGIRIMENVYAVERSDISFLESECQQIVLSTQQSDSWIIGTRTKLLEESETAISAAMAAGDFNEVIRLYEQFTSSNDDQFSFETSYSYGQSLLRTDREQEAGRFFQDLLYSLHQQNQIGREFQLMQLVADIQFGLEEYPTAFDRYVNIINRYAGFGDTVEWARKQQGIISARGQHGIEVRSYADLLLAYLTYNPKRDGFKVALMAERFIESFPESTVITTANRILFESQDSADAWFAGMVQRLNLLEDEKKYAEAVQLIDKLPLVEMPVEKREYIRDRADELITAQFQEAEFNRLAQEATLQETWAKGETHLRAREYDLAIGVFTNLLETDYRDRAQVQIDEAVNLAAQEDRRRAAELFVRSSSSKDFDTRVQLLFESRQLLLNILVKYPQSGLVDKVRRNLDRIEQEINAIDPSLLANPPQTRIAPAVIEEQPVRARNGNSMNMGELQVHSTSNNWSSQRDEDINRSSILEEDSVQGVNTHE